MFAFRRRHALLGALFVVALLLTVVAVSLTRQRRFEDRWAKVQTGMSKDEVRQVLGDPKQIYLAGTLQSDSVVSTIVANWLFDSTREKWAYGQRRLFALDGFLAPEDDDHVVYFSKDGRVVKKQYPYRVAKPTAPGS